MPVAIFRLGRRWSRVLAFVIALSLLPYSAIFLLVSLFEMPTYKDGHDIGFDLIADTPWRKSHVRLYRDDGPAFADDAVFVRQERPLLPGLSVIRTLEVFRSCSSLSSAPTKDGVVVIDGPHDECPGFDQLRHEYRLKPFVYF